MVYLMLLKLESPKLKGRLVFVWLKNVFMSSPVLPDSPLTSPCTYGQVFNIIELSGKFEVEAVSMLGPTATLDRTGCWG